MSGFYYERNQVLDDTGWDLQGAGSKRWLMMGLGVALILVALSYPYFQDRREIRRLKAATVWVLSDFGTGSGFFINSQGDLLTNHHVVVDKTGKKSNSIKVIIHSGTDQRAELDASIVTLGGADPKAEENGNIRGDWALLKLEETPPAEISFLQKTEQQVSSTDDVYSLGFPDQGDAATEVEVSVNSGSVRKVDKSANQELRIDHQSGLDFGMSGGPLVLKETLEVVGINTMIRSSEVAKYDYALPITSLPADVLNRFGK